VAGEYSLPFLSIPPGTVQPAFAQSVPLALGNLTLLGHTAPAEAAPGAPLAVDLLLDGGEQYADTAVQWSLRPVDQSNVATPGAAPVLLWSGPLAPRVRWSEGEVLCRRLKATLPADLPPGKYLMHLTTADYDQPFAEIAIGD